LESLQELTGGEGAIGAAPKREDWDEVIRAERERNEE
jgi:hypothetical protein